MVDRLLKDADPLPKKNIMPILVPSNHSEQIWRNEACNNIFIQQVSFHNHDLKASSAAAENS